MNKENAVSLTANNSTSNSTQSNQISTSNGFPVSEAPNLAAELSKNGIQSIEYKGVNLDKNQFLYIFARAIVMINKGENGNIPIKSISSAESPSGMLSSSTLTKSQYVDMAGRTYNWIDSNGKTPNYVGIVTPGSPDLSPDLTLLAFVKVLNEYRSNGQLPQSITVP